MERVKTLVEKLQNQLAQGAGKADLLSTIQFLYNEALALPSNATSENTVAHFAQAVPMIKMQTNEGETSFGEQAPIISPEENIAEQPEKMVEASAVEKVGTEKPFEPLPIKKPTSIYANNTPNEITTTTEIPTAATTESTKVEEEEAPIIFELKVDEEELEAELEEIKKNAERLNNMSSPIRPSNFFNLEDDAPPTLSQHIAQATPSQSLNDRLKPQKSELADQLNASPIKDLRKGVNLNEKFVFISELFRGDETMYERSIKTINDFSIYPEAEYWIRRELKLKLGWDETKDTVKKFDQLVKRRFSVI